jgi:hypothetical protein
VTREEAIAAWDQQLRDVRAVKARLAAANLSFVPELGAPPIEELERSAEIATWIDMLESARSVVGKPGWTLAPRPDGDFNLIAEPGAEWPGDRPPQEWSGQIAPPFEPERGTLQGLGIALLTGLIVLSGILAFTAMVIAAAKVTEGALEEVRGFRETALIREGKGAELVRVKEAQAKIQEEAGTLEKLGGQVSSAILWLGVLFLFSNLAGAGLTAWGRRR